MTERAVLVKKGLVYSGHRRTNFDIYIPIEGSAVWYGCCGQLSHPYQSSLTEKYSVFIIVSLLNFGISTVTTKLVMQLKSSL